MYTPVRKLASGRVYNNDLLFYSILIKSVVR